MRIKFIVMMLSLLSMLQISLLSLFTFIRVEVDLGPRVNIVYLVTYWPWLPLLVRWAQSWALIGPWDRLSECVSFSDNIIPALWLRCVPGAFLSIPSVSILGWNPPHHSRYNYIQTDYVEHQQPWFLITLPVSCSVDITVRREQMGGPW